MSPSALQGVLILLIIAGPHGAFHSCCLFPSVTRWRVIPPPRGLPAASGFTTFCPCAPLRWAPCSLFDGAHTRFLSDCHLLCDLFVSAYGFFSHELFFPSHFRSCAESILPPTPMATRPSPLRAAGIYEVAFPSPHAFFSPASPFGYISCFPFDMPASLRPSLVIFSFSSSFFR